MNLLTTLKILWVSALWTHAFVTLGATIQWLPPLPGTVRLRVFAITPDGRTAVGISDDVSVKAFRWTAEKGVEDLGHLGAFWAQATDVSDDGRIILGASSSVVPGSGSNIPTEIVVWKDGIIQGTGVFVKDRNSPMMLSGDGRFVLYGTNSLPDRILSLPGEDFGLPEDISPRLMSKDGSTVFGISSTNLVRWNRTSGVRTMLATGRLQVEGVVAQSGLPAVFKGFSVAPQVWVEDFHGHTGFFEMVRLFGTSGRLFITSDGQWLTLADSFQRPVIEVWPRVIGGDPTRWQSHNVPIPLEAWIGATNVPPDFDLTKFRPTALSGFASYHLAGWVPYSDLATYNKAFLIRDITPRAGITPVAQFNVTIQGSIDMKQWTEVTNVTLLAPVTLTNGFFRMVVSP